MVTSFTRAAAAELLARDLSVPDEHVGTLHGICYRWMGKPPIAETKLNEWNDKAPGLLQLSTKTSSAAIDDPYAERTSKAAGDAYLSRMQRLRARMVPHKQWPADVERFSEMWEKWKEDNGYMDFTDMLDHALRMVEIAPGNPEVIFADEVQDFTKLQWTLLRKWAKHADVFVAAGDEDQCIFSFTGASPESMLEPELPPEQIHILRQSHRLPRTVHAYSQKLIKRVARRMEKEFNPEDRDGSVARIPANFRAPESIFRVIDEHLQRDETVMILASCGYMLHNTINALRQRGYMYHNPYRVTQGAWNPIRRSADRNTSVDRLLAYMRPDVETFGDRARFWTYEDVKSFTDLLAANGVLKRGAKKVLREMGEPEIYSDAKIEFLCDAIFEEAALYDALDCDLDWFRKHLTKAGEKRLEFPLAIAKARGVATLNDEPKIIVGTCHSVKGGEADAVIIWPDISAAAMGQQQSSIEGRDAITRTFYVGVTRARKALYIGEPATQYCVAL